MSGFFQNHKTRTAMVLVSLSLVFFRETLAFAAENNFWFEGVWSDYCPTKETAAKNASRMFPGDDAGAIIYFRNSGKLYKGFTPGSYAYVSNDMDDRNAYLEDVFEITILSHKNDETVLYYCFEPGSELIISVLKKVDFFGTVGMIAMSTGVTSIEEPEGVRCDSPHKSKILSAVNARSIIENETLAPLYLRRCGSAGS